MAGQETTTATSGGASSTPFLTHPFVPPVREAWIDLSYGEVETHDPIADWEAGNADLVGLWGDPSAYQIYNA